MKQLYFFVFWLIRLFFGDWSVVCCLGFYSFDVFCFGYWWFFMGCIVGVYFWFLGLENQFVFGEVVDGFFKGVAVVVVGIKYRLGNFYLCQFLLGYFMGGKVLFWGIGYVGVVVVFRLMVGLVLKSGDFMVVWFVLYVKIVNMVVFFLLWIVIGRVVIDIVFVGQNFYYKIESLFRGEFSGSIFVFFRQFRFRKVFFGGGIEVKNQNVQQ